MNIFLKNNCYSTCQGLYNLRECESFSCLHSVKKLLWQSKKSHQDCVWKPLGLVLYFIWILSELKPRDEELESRLKAWRECKAFFICTMSTEIPACGETREGEKVLLWGEKHQRNLGWCRENSHWNHISKRSWNCTGLLPAHNPKTASTFVLRHQKLPELPKAAVQHFLQRCCLIPAPTQTSPVLCQHQIQPWEFREMLPVLDFRVSHPSSASFEQSLHFFLSASRSSRAELSLPCASDSLLCSSAPHLAT